MMLVCFEIFDISKQGYLTQTQLIEVMKLITTSYNYKNKYGIIFSVKSFNNSHLIVLTKSVLFFKS